MKHVLDSENSTKAPEETFEDTSRNLEVRGKILDEKINKLEGDLIKLREQIHQTGPGILQETTKRRALQILKRKRLLETQRDQLSNQQFNLERVSFAMESARETMIAFKLLESAQKDFENQIKSQELDVKEINEMREDQEDLMDHQQEVQESLDQSYGLLEAIGELEDLEDEMKDDLRGLEIGQVPSYLLTPSEVVLLPPAPVSIIQNKTPPEKQDQKQDVYEISAIPETI